MMATTKTATKSKSVRAKGWTQDEETVFADLGVGEGEVSLRNLIRGQRAINKKFYETLALILDSMTKKSKGAPGQSLAEAERINELVPGDPPGCGDSPVMP